MAERDQFVFSKEPYWKRLDQLLSRDVWKHRTAGTISEAMSLYRSVCADLMYARQRRLGPDLVQHLNTLAARGHNVLYGPRGMALKGRVLETLAGFPSSVRRNWRCFVVAFLLFWAPFVAAFLGALGSEEFAHRIAPPGMLDEMAQGYAEGFAEGRSESQDTAMAGFYVRNNVGIAFRCFATGVLFGLGSMFFLVYNGLLTGTVVGWVVANGAGTNILTFICGHSPYELTAIIISGAAGLQMGFALVSTGGRTRLGSLQSVAPDLARQVAGAAGLLLLAALVEGYWSPSSAPNEVKWVVGAVGTMATIAYLAFAGLGKARGPKSG